MKPIIQKLVTLTAMLLSMLTASAYDFEYNGMYFNIISTADLTCEITYKDGNYNTYAGNVTIPSEVEYKGRTLTVTRIQDAFRDCINLTSVTIPNSVPVISGFSNCTSLTSVNIPNSATDIFSYAFEGCTSLTAVNIPNSVTEIDASAFADCSNLTAVNIPNSVIWIGAGAFYNCSQLSQVIFEKGEKELFLQFRGGYQEMFSEDEILTDITIGRNIRIQRNNNNNVWEGFRDKLNLEYITNLTFLDDVNIENFFTYNDYSGTLVNLTIGKNVANYPYSLEQYSNLQTITLKDPVPQRCPKFVTKQYTDMIIYVPKGSLSAYQNAYGWENFWDIREGEYSGIEDTAVTPAKTEVGRYDLQGRKVGEDYRGMVIVRFSDGSVKKTIVR